ncbi:MAG: hypothetical protein V1891_01890, partial [bacterium]
MKRNLFVFVTVAMLFCFGVFGCGDGNDENSAIEEAVLFVSGEKVVGHTINISTDGVYDSIKVTDANKVVLLQAEPELEAERQKSYTDANNSVSIDVNWDENSSVFSFVAWKEGIYLITGNVGKKVFSEVIIVVPLKIFCEFTKGSYDVPSKIKISSNGENMEYLVRFATNEEALTALNQRSSNTEYSIGIIGEHTPITIEITAYCKNIIFNRTIEIDPVVSNYNSGSYNRQPNIIAIYPDPNMFVDAEFYVFVYASDPDGDTLFYKWSSSDPNEIQFLDPNATETTVALSSKAEEFIITVTVSDGELTATENISLFTINPAETQEQDPNSLYEDGNMVVGDQIVFHKKTGIIEIKQFRSLLTEEGQIAYDSNAPIYALGKFNGWVPVDPNHELQ